MPERIGKYRVIGKIASGGMADVYLCRVTGEEGFEKKIAVKVIRARLSEDRRFRESFAREARIAASLVHPNLVQVFDFGRERGSHYLAMEFIDGWNLAQAISQARLRSMSFPLPVWRYWMEGILAGIGHLHSRGIVHRDISPSNILLSRGGVVKITDFGISRGMRVGEEESGWEGKFAYLSPEQARGESASTGTDLFAAAIISAEFFLPHRLFNDSSAEATLSRLRSFDEHELDLRALPPPVLDTVRKGLSAARNDRYSDADEFAHAVCAAAPLSARRVELETFWNDLFPDTSGDEDTAIGAPPAGKGSDVVREDGAGYGNDKKRFLKIGLVGALAALSVGGWAIWKRGSPPSTSPATLPSPPPVPVESRSLSKPVEHGADPAEPAVRTERAVPNRPSTDPDARSPETRSKVVVLETDPPGVSASLEDGTLLGRTPLSVDIGPWAGRTILFRREGYGEKRVAVDVLGQFQTFRLELERQMGTIEVIQAIPWAKVFDGDRVLGVTPLRNVTLTVGRHRLRFVNEPLGIERVQEINVRLGANPKVIVSLVEKTPTD